VSTFIKAPLRGFYTNILSMSDLQAGQSFDPVSMILPAHILQLNFPSDALPDPLHSVQVCGSGTSRVPLHFRHFLFTLSIFTFSL
jgi:hypothetical protein